MLALLRFLTLAFGPRMITPDEGGGGGIPDTGGSVDFDVDAALSAIDGDGGDGIPMTAQETATDQATTQTPPEQTPAAFEIELNVNGQKIKLPANDPRLTQWAQQGRDYAQRVQEIQAKQAEFQAKEKQFSEIESRYKPIDEYVQKNPQFWDHVLQQWQQAQAQSGEAVDPNHPLAREITQLKQSLNEISQFKQSIENERQAQVRAQEDAQLTDEIKSIRDTYKDLDFDAPGADGTSLEMRVLKHAADNGIRSFKTAFRDLLHDDLLKRAEERGKEAINKDIQKRSKLGLLGTSPAPTKEITSAQGVKNKSYDGLLQETLAELGLA